MVPISLICKWFTQKQLSVTFTNTDGDSVNVTLFCLRRYFIDIFITHFITFIDIFIHLVLIEVSWKFKRHYGMTWVAKKCIMGVQVSEAATAIVL